jgi:hypothetical protein
LSEWKRRKAKITRKTLIGLSMLFLLLFGVSAGLAPTSVAEPVNPRRGADAVPTVSLRAASGATVWFTTWNGHTIDGVPPEERELPYLVLYRNGTLSEAVERTLLVEVSGLEVPPAGLTVTLDLVTMHGDPDLGSNYGQRIWMWRASQRIAGRLGSTRSNVTTTFMHTFTETVVSGERIISTPTDYIRYEVTVTAPGDTNAAHRLSEDYAFLLEDQWIAPLPQVAEAAPDELIVHYADMFPFRRSTHEPPSWVRRNEVTTYVGTELVPGMVEAFRVQNEEWGFTWHEAWTSYRGEDGRRRLSVALTDSQTWFHGQAPDGGHSGISLRVSNGNNAPFATLTDGLLSTFHHELFHQWQRSISLHSGGDGNVSGVEDAWGLFSEGTAVLAASLGQPRGQFMQKLPGRTYMSTANGFVVRGGGRTTGLNVAYRELDPYEGAIYWRFLYEQCGGGDSQRPAAGMQVIQRALTVLYSGQIVDIGSSTDVVTALPAIMDQALAGSLCPFQTYDDSLIAFARAIYGLRWMQGRCVEPGLPAGCGFYDPYSQYYEPPISRIAYTGTDQTYEDQIGSSFGIDLLDVRVEPAVAREPLVLAFRPPAGSDAVFSVEIWQLPPSANAGVRQRVFTGIVHAEALMEMDAHGELSYTIPADYTGAPRTLHLIVTRLDVWESLDPTGEYSIALHPAPRS